MTSTKPLKERLATDSLPNVFHKRSSMSGGRKLSNEYLESEESDSVRNIRPPTHHQNPEPSMPADWSSYLSDDVHGKNESTRSIRPPIQHQHSEHRSSVDGYVNFTDDVRA